MASTYRFFILCFMLAEETLADPAENILMGKAFMLPAAPAARPMQPGSTKLDVQPFGSASAMPKGAEANAALAKPGPLANMERDLARVAHENSLMKSELQQFTSQIEQMEAVQHQRQREPEIVKSSLLADLRLWVSFAGVAVGAILYSIIVKLRTRYGGVTAMSASPVAGTELLVAGAGGMVRGGRSAIPMMEAAELELDGKDVRIGIIKARDYEEDIDSLVAGVKESLKACGVPEDSVVLQEVPGSFELPLATRFLALSKTVDAIIPIGALIKDKTMNCDVMSQTVTSALMSVGMQTSLPVIMGVLTCSSDRDLKACSSGAKNRGLQWGKIAVEMALLRNSALGKTKKQFLGFGSDPEGNESGGSTSNPSDAPKKIAF